MKKLFLLLAVTAISVFAFSQKQSINWGEEFKMKKGSNNLTVVHTDKSGVYLQEEHLAMKSYFVIGASFRESASMVKLDKNLNELYRSDFNKELKGKEFVQFFAFNDKLLIIASEYQKSERTTLIYGAEIDKSNGMITETWKPITSFQKEEKKDEIIFKLIPNVDTSRIVVISTVSGKEKSTYQVQEFDKNLKAVTKPATISNEYEAKTYKLEDVLYTTDQKIILVGRVFEYQEGKKKKERFLDFANYSIRIYNESGKQLNEVNTNINGRWLTSTKLMMGKGRELILASFYSKERKGKSTDGLMVQRIDPNTGNVLSTAEKNIDHSLLATDNGESDDDKDDDKDNESREERKEREKLAKIKDEGEAFSRYMKFRNIFYTPDNGLVLLAEDFHFFTYTTSYQTGGMNGSMGTWNYYTNYVYDCKDIMMVKIDAANNISWLQVLPKSQRESIRLPQGGGIFTYNYFFEEGSARPFYAGFGAIQSPSGIQIYFNDKQNNADVLQPGKKLSRLINFSKSECFVVTLDPVTGKFQRRSFFSNSDQPIAMPRLGAVIGNEMYLVGRTDRMLAKTKIMVGKISTK